MTALLDRRAELNSSNSELMQRGWTRMSTKHRLHAICNAADSFGEAKQAHLRNYSIYDVCEPQKRKKNAIVAEWSKVHDFGCIY